MDKGIPFYLCSIEEFAQLAALAQERGTVPEHTRGTFSIERGLEFLDQTTFEEPSGRSRTFSPLPAATQPREENPLVQCGYGPVQPELFYASV